MENNDKNKSIYVIVIAILSVLSVIVATVMLFSGSMIREYLEENLNTEMICFIVITALAILVMLFALALSLRSENKNPEPQVISAAGVSLDANGVIAQTAKASDDEGEIDTPEEASEGRFCKLCNLDQIKGSIQRDDYDEYITLRQFCENFRNYAANKLKLYYDISDIRRFVAGMAVSKMLILQGMSGTGKTSLAHAFGDFIDNPSTVIPVQPMWKERTDLIGYYNEFTKRFNETTLLEKMYEANYSKDIYITVMDEMNIARVEYYFAEFLSLLELPNAEERLLTVVSDVWEDDPTQLENGNIKLPPNMWFIGTANNDDSTFAISDKVYDRAMIMNLDSKAEPFVAPTTGNTRISASQFEELAEQAMREYEVTSRNLHRIELLDNYLIEHFQITFGNRIMKQIKNYIPVFVACGGDELEALDDILSKKVLRKLEMQNPIYLRSASAGLVAYLDELFGYDRMPLCKAFMARLQRTI